MASKEGKNTIYNTIKTLFGIIYPLITFPYISRILMAENVGKINFGNSIVSYFTLIASLGVSTYAIRECSKVRENQEELSKIASQILSINLFSTIISYLALVVVLIVASPLENYRQLICIQSSVILFTTLGADWINTSMEDFKFIAVRTVSMQVVSIILMFVFIHKPDDYIKYALISVIATSGANIINIFYRRKYCKIKFTLKMDLARHLKPILLLFSMLISQTIFCNSDMTMLGLFKGDTEVGLYSTSVKIYNLVNTVVASVTWVVMPKLAFNFSQSNYKEVNRLLRYALNFIVVIGMPSLVGLNIITKPIIETIGGVEYIGACTSLHILTVSLALSFLGGWIGNMMMLPAGRESICLRSSIVAAIANVILNLILIPKYGINAAATTTAFSEFIGIFTKVFYIDKNIKIEKIWSVLKAPCIGSCAVFLIGYIIPRFVSSPAYITLLTIIISVFLYLSILMIFRNEFICEFINPLIKKFKR